MIGQNDAYLRERWLEFWNKENHDRPLISVEVPLSTRDTPPRAASLEEHWGNPDYIVAASRWHFEHTWYGGEAMPILNPNLGPDFVGAVAGCNLIYSPYTSWAQASPRHGTGSACCRKYRRQANAFR